MLEHPRRPLIYFLVIAAPLLVLLSLLSERSTHSAPLSHRFGAVTETPTLPPVTSTAMPLVTSTEVPTATPTACTVRFEDVPPGSTFYPYVQCLACAGVMSGYPCGGPGEPCGPGDNPYFRPYSLTTRGQIAKLVSQSAGFSDPVDTQTFEDVPPGSTFYDFVERLAVQGVMNGYPCGSNPTEPCVAPDNRPYFRPNASATRGQLVKIGANAASFIDPIPLDRQTFADIPPDTTFWIHVERLLQNRPGAVSGYPCGGPGEPCDGENRPYFRPDSPITRGQTSKIVAGLFFPDCIANPPRSPAKP
jgi:hypothetical protein